MAKKIYISPSDQGKNQYGAGNTVEEVQCEKIATALVNALQRCKFEAKTDLTANMNERVSQSNNWKADLHVCIHTNAYNGKVSGTRLFCYALGDEGHKACKAVMATLAPITPGTSDGIQARPELYECRAAKAPTVYVEVDFHDVPDVALWIITHTTEIAEAIAEGICNHYGVAYVAPTPATTTAETDNATNEIIKRYIDQLIAKQKDNDCGKWSKDAREWAIANGIILGIGNGPDGAPNYAWEASVTREQFVTMLHRFAKLIGKA
jgi:N-acetylmuramoyl-L-alanine amidase